MLKNVIKGITLKIEGLPPLVYRTKLMHFLETKLTLSSHTWGDLARIEVVLQFKVRHATSWLSTSLIIYYWISPAPFGDVTDQYAFAQAIWTTPSLLLVKWPVQSRPRRSDNGILQPRWVPRTLSESHVIPGEQRRQWRDFYKLNNNRSSFILVEETWRWKILLEEEEEEEEEEEKDYVVFRTTFHCQFVTRIHICSARPLANQMT